MDLRADTAEEAALGSLRHTFLVDGLEAVATVSPCSWMYPTYGLQVEVRVAGGKTYYNSKTRFDQATVAEAVALAEQVRLAPCVLCTKPAIANAPRSNREGQCEACFMEKLNAEFAKISEREAKREANRDAAAVKRGFAFKTVAWVHPERGDDHQIAWYSVAEPTRDDVRRVLEKRRSKITTDFRTSPLTPRS